MLAVRVRLAVTVADAACLPATPFTLPLWQILKEAWEAPIVPRGGLRQLR